MKGLPLINVTACEGLGSTASECISIGLLVEDFRGTCFRDAFDRTSEGRLLVVGCEERGWTEDVPS